ncbi:hypothetical protein B0H17DRAFT_1217685 [Mycena rosella]|uniref:Uncharacterized protein n=1 Tax=Mycena rosella TaxID=1033263 RepID=A0AAD7FLS0_MYCRO|nr:hypothetical protein B0H17DRAFT_1217685 [Mycena rosella]
MLSYFIPLAVISSAPLLSNASPVLPIGPIIPAAAGAATVTATATLTIFQCPTASPASAGLPLILPIASNLVNPALSGAVSAVTGLPTIIPIHPGGGIPSSVIANVLSSATGLVNPSILPSALSSVLSAPTVIPSNLVNAASSALSAATALASPILVPASSIVSGATTFIRDPIAVPSGVIPSLIGIPTGDVSSLLSSIVSTAMSDATSLLAVAAGGIPSNGGGANLPTGVLSSGISSATGAASDVSTILSPLKQVSTSLDNVSSACQVSSAPIQSLNTILSGLSSSTDSPTDAAQFLNQGTAIAQRVASLTNQINTIIVGSQQSPTPINLTQLRTALKTLQTRLQTMYTGLIPHCGTPAQSQVLNGTWATTAAALNTCILKT